MNRDLTLSEISSSEWISLNQFLQEIKEIDSLCISVYYPYGKGQEIIGLFQETKKSELLERIELKIQKRIMELKKKPVSVGKFTKTLCIFGWIKNGKVHIKEIGTSQKLPYVYMANKKPYIKPFSDILKTNYDILLVTLDQKTARIQKFHGNQIIQESKLKIDLQGRHKKGGQSQGRFLRARQTKIHVFFKKVANKVRLMNSNSELILLGGNGHAKTEFYDELNSELTSKCRFVEGLSFITPMNDIHKIIIHHLYEYRKKHMGELIKKYAWQYYGGHHHENIFTKFCIGYWQYEKFNSDKRIISYSAQVISGDITRNEAIKIIKEPPLNIDAVKELKILVIKKLDLTNDEFEKIWNSSNKSFYDYPSY